MSHQEYVADCDEDQLVRLIELAQEKLKTIREGGWVKLWVVSADYANHAWSDNYDEAIKHLRRVVEQHANAGRHVEIHLTEGRYRPAEAAELLKEAANG